jgi:arsenate reductase
MAETFLNAFGGDGFVAESAGLDPQGLNPLVIEVMREIGFDLSNNVSKSLFDYFRAGRLYDYVITVCDESIEDRCPLFPGIRKRLHWPFKDPAKVQGTQADQLSEVRKIRDEIKLKIEDFINATRKEVNSEGYSPPPH